MMLLLMNAEIRNNRHEQYEQQRISNNVRAVSFQKISADLRNDKGNRHTMRVYAQLHRTIAITTMPRPRGRTSKQTHKILGIGAQTKNPGIYIDATEQSNSCANPRSDCRTLISAPLSSLTNMTMRTMIANMGSSKLCVCRFPLKAITAQRLQTTVFGAPQW